MTEQAQPGKDLILSSQRKLMHLGGEIENPTPAERILLTVFSIHESTLTSREPATQIGEYSVGQIWNAFKTVAKDRLGRYPQDVVLGHISKQNENGSVSLGLNKHRPRSSREEGEAMVMYYLPNDNGVVFGGIANKTSFQMPVDDIAIKAEHPTFGFTEPGKITRLKNLQENYSPEDFAHFWRGCRFAAINLLVWDRPGIIVRPEDLN